MNRHDPAETLRAAYQELIMKTGLKARELAQRFAPWLHPHHAARYIELLGYHQAMELFKVTEDKIIKTIRVNTLIASPDMVVKRLARKGFKTKRHPYIDYGIVIESEPLPVGATREYMLGMYTVQGPASMLAVPAMRPETLPRGSLVADMCAGAGVKTTQIAQHNPEVNIIALDINKRKLAALKNNLSRLAVDNVIAINMDARDLLKLGYMFDAILLDAPCSGEGLVPFKKGRWPRTFEDIISRVTLQLQLLDAAAKTLKPGGILLYSTCSMSVEENEYVTSLAAEKHGLEYEDPGVPGEPGVTQYLGLPIKKEASRCRRLYPHLHSTEGFTICRLRKQ